MAPIAVRRGFQKKLVDCENCESGGGNYDNTWADQQALIAHVNTGARCISLHRRAACRLVPFRRPANYENCVEAITENNTLRVPLHWPA